MDGATQRGSFASFMTLMTLWVPMVMAMMLPGIVPNVLRRLNSCGRVRTALVFVGAYLTVWVLAGVAIWAFYRPQGSMLAGTIAIAAGVYELTPLKQLFRRRCRENVGSGFEVGLVCIGSCTELMLVQVAFGIMSVTWMSGIAAVVLAQKCVPARAAIDVPLALAIVGLGIVILIAPSSVPGLMRP